MKVRKTIPGVWVWVVGSIWNKVNSSPLELGLGLGLTIRIRESLIICFQLELLNSSVAPLNLSFCQILPSSVPVGKSSQTRVQMKWEVRCNGLQ